MAAYACMSFRLAIARRLTSISAGVGAGAAVKSLRGSMSSSSVDPVDFVPQTVLKFVSDHLCAVNVIPWIQGLRIARSQYFKMFILCKKGPFRGPRITNPMNFRGTRVQGPSIQYGNIPGTSTANGILWIHPTTQNIPNHG